LPKVKENHFDENGKHNDAFDHQVFLGERSNEFDNLTNEEAGLRLGLIFDQIDLDNSTMVSEEELTRWIKEVARERVEARVEEFWTRSNPSGQEDISWEDFHTEQYAFLEESHITVRIADYKIFDHIANGPFFSNKPYHIQSKLYPNCLLFHPGQNVTGEPKCLRRSGGKGQETLGSCGY